MLPACSIHNLCLFGYESMGAQKVCQTRKNVVYLKKENVLVT